MINYLRKGLSVLFAASMVLCISCSNENSYQSNQFDVIQMKVTKGEPLTQQEQEAFSKLNQSNHQQKPQETESK
jgi:hypothetical protein